MEILLHILRFFVKFSCFNPVESYCLSSINEPVRYRIIIMNVWG